MVFKGQLYCSPIGLINLKFESSDTVTASSHPERGEKNRMTVQQYGTLADAGLSIWNLSTPIDKG